MRGAIAHFSRSIWQPRIYFFKKYTIWLKSPSNFQKASTRYIITRCAEFQNT